MALKVVFSSYALINRGSKDHMNIKILQTMFSGVPLVLDLRARMWEPYVYVVFGAPDHSSRQSMPVHLKTVSVPSTSHLPSWLLFQRLHVATCYIHRPQVMICHEYGVVQLHGSFGCSIAAAREPNTLN